MSGPGRNAPERKLLKRACDACKVRKIKCSELPPCEGCKVAGISCTFKKVPGLRGPRTLRAKTVQQINQQQKRPYHDSDGPEVSCPSTDAWSKPSFQNADIHLFQDRVR